jgi:hypothetical protein
LEGSHEEAPPEKFGRGFFFLFAAVAFSVHHLTRQPHRATACCVSRESKISDEMVTRAVRGEKIRLNLKLNQQAG